MEPFNCQLVGTLSNVAQPLQSLHRIPGKIRNGRLVKEVKRGRHFLRWLRGYAWSLEQLERAKAQGVHTLELREDSGRSLRVGLDYVLAKGKRFQHDIYEPQVGVPENSMTVLDPRQLELFT